MNYSRCQYENVLHPIMDLSCSILQRTLGPSEHNMQNISPHVNSYAKPEHLHICTISRPFQKKMYEVVRTGGIIILHLSNLWKAKFFIRCDKHCCTCMIDSFWLYHGEIADIKNRLLACICSIGNHKSNHYSKTQPLPCEACSRLGMEWCELIHHC